MQWEEEGGGVNAPTVAALALGPDSEDAVPRWAKEGRHSMKKEEHTPTAQRTRGNVRDQQMVRLL